jgi:hypothetical protein
VLPQAPRLQAIARDLKPPATPPTWWERFKSWISGWLDPGTGRWPDWLRFLAHLNPGQRVFTVLIYALAGLLVIAAAAVVVIELRAAGVIGAGRRRKTPVRRADAAAPPAWEDSPDAADITSAPVRLRPVLLLRQLVAALTHSQRLERDRDLTCRELIEVGRFDTTVQREVFARVALLAEQALYASPQSVVLPVAEELVVNARRLRAQLLAAPAAAPAAV